MAYLAARTCSTINGVSHLHGKVSQGIFKDLYPRWPEREIPVSYVTNGVHVPSWDSPWSDKIWTNYCGKDRWLGTENDLATAIEALDDETIWTLCGEERADLVRRARQRLRLQLAQRGTAADIVNQVDQALDEMC